MRVLLVNVNAITGSTGKIVSDIKSVLEAQGHECMIAYGANTTINSAGYTRICHENERKLNAALARFTGVLYGMDSPLPFRRLKRLIAAWKPDVVNMHCANGYILNLFDTLNYLAINNIKTVVTNHAEFYYTGGCGHAYDCQEWLSGCKGKCPEIKHILPTKPAALMWQRFHTAFAKFKPENILITSVSPWVENRAKQSEAMKRFNHITVMNGVDTSIFHPTKPSEDVINRLPAGKPMVLHVSAQFTTFHTNKGGDYICELAKRMPDVNFVVAASYLGHIEGLPENVIIWGRTSSQQELAMLYTAADATVITSYRETFSMVTAECLCCGTPMVGFRAGGPESISLKPYATFVEYGKVDALDEALRNMMSRALPASEIAQEAHQKYSREIMTKNYINAYKQILS